MKEKMVAFCGIVCDDCRALIATQRNDRKLKEEVAGAWSTEKEILKPEDIKCDGCLPTGRRLFKSCDCMISSLTHSSFFSVGILMMRRTSTWGLSRANCTVFSKYSLRSLSPYASGGQGSSCVNQTLSLALLRHSVNNL